tara:strand:- start:522 stop:857 length:336 start_codon:yes stop_codon:yes gene_type:complete
MSTGGEANLGPDPSNQDTEGAEETTAEQGTAAADTPNGEPATGEEETYSNSSPAENEVSEQEDSRTNAQILELLDAEVGRGGGPEYTIDEDLNFESREEFCEQNPGHSLCQ